MAAPGHGKAREAAERQAISTAGHTSSSTASSRLPVVYSASGLRCLTDSCDVDIPSGYVAITVIDIYEHGLTAMMERSAAQQMAKHGWRVARSKRRTRSGTNRFFWRALQSAVTGELNDEDLQSSTVIEAGLAVAWYHPDLQKQHALRVSIEQTFKKHNAVHLRIVVTGWEADKSIAMIVHASYKREAGH